MRHCIPYQCNAVIKLFQNSEAWLWKCYHVTINGSHLTFFAKVTQLWYNVILMTSSRHCKFNVTVTTYRRCYYNIHDMLWGGFTFYFEATLTQRCEFDVAISTLKQRYQHNIHNMPWVKLIIELWGKVGLTFWFDVVASTSLQRYVLDVHRCDLITTL